MARGTVNLNSGLPDSEMLAFNLLLYCLHKEKVTVGICDIVLDKKNTYLVIWVTKILFSYIYICSCSLVLNHSSLNLGTFLNVESVSGVSFVMLMRQFLEST